MYRKNIRTIDLATQESKQVKIFYPKYAYKRHTVSAYISCVVKVFEILTR